MSNGWDYQLPNYTARMITVMDIDHYESDEGGIGLISNLIHLVLQ